MSINQVYQTGRRFQREPNFGGDKIEAMVHYDLCLTWCWKYDLDFINLLEKACLELGLSVLQVTPVNLNELRPALEGGQLSYSIYLDRTEHEAPYDVFSDWAKDNTCYRINPRDAADRAEDKAVMHPVLVNAGLETPRTIILPALNEQPDLPEIDLGSLGECFVIKPCFGGGGEGVVMGATTLNQVMERRGEFPHLKYLLQQTIVPRKMDGRDAWFRVICCDENYYSCWWDPKTHVYTSVTAEEEDRHGLAILKKIAHRIDGLCGLGFFSTEIAVDLDGRWVVIDYINDQIDMRLQSQAVDGVPDAVVAQVCRDLAQKFHQVCKKTPST